MMGVYGMLAIGLALFCLRYLIPRGAVAGQVRQDLVLVAATSAWPGCVSPPCSRSGVLQLYKSVSDGYFAARQLEFITNPSNSPSSGCVCPATSCSSSAARCRSCGSAGWGSATAPRQPDHGRAPGRAVHPDRRARRALGAADASSVTVSPEVLLFTGYAGVLLVVGVRPRPARPAQPRPVRPLPHRRVPLPPAARRVGVPAGPDAVAHLYDRAQQLDALPGQAVGLQRLPGQDRLHQLAARPRDHPPDPAVAALRGRRGSTAGWCWCSSAWRRCCWSADDLPAPPARRPRGHHRAARRRRAAGASVHRPLPADAGRLPRGHRRAPGCASPHRAAPRWASDREGRS